MARCESTPLCAALTRLLPRETVEDEARRLGVVERQRKVDIFAFVWVLALGFQVGTKRTIEAYRLAYQRATGQYIERSSFHDRFNPKLAMLLRHLALSAMASFTARLGPLQALLGTFKEMLVIDTTIVRLNRFLASVYPGTGKRGVRSEASAKLHVVMRVLDGSPTQVKITDGRTHDCSVWKRVGAWVQGRLLLLDLGYWAFSLFDRIDTNGGFFISRVKSSANPLIVAQNLRWRGRSAAVVGRRLKDVLRTIKREVLDVQVQVRFQRRAWRGKKSWTTRTFRLVAIRNDETGRYHCYLTNVGVEVVDAETVAETYRLRWQVEILFKCLRSHGHFDHVPSRKRAVVDVLLWSSLLGQLAGHALFLAVRHAVNPWRRIPLLRWSVLFSRVVDDVLRVVLGDDHGAGVLERLLLREAPDPNHNRADRSISPELMRLWA